MVVKNLTQGQGISTEFKERGLQAAFTINLKIFQSKFSASRWRYFHFDLNSGNGMNDEIGCIGSPLAFLQAAHGVGCNRFFAGFCDKDESKLEALFKRQELQRDDCWPFNGDNSDLPYAIPDVIRIYNENPYYAVGMILVDPNGAKIPLDAMEWLSSKCKRIDFVINWNSTSAKRNRGALGEDHTPSLENVIQRLKKKYWLIREPLSSHQFTLLIGRNTLVSDHKNLRFYHLSSSKGQDIFNRCNLTQKQYDLQCKEKQQDWINDQSIYNR